VFSGSYVVPKPFFTDNKILTQVLKDWQVSAVLRYQSGQLLSSPSSLNGIESELDRTTGEGNGAYPGGVTPWNLTNGATNLLLVNPNSHFDPTKQLVLNPAAWTDAPAGQFGASAFYYNNYRWQRQPAESMAFARNFRFGKEGRYNLSVRGEFQNIFNRHFFNAPTVGNPSATTANTNAFVQGGPAAGAISSGFGYVSYLNGTGDTPRSGQAVARFTF